MPISSREMWLGKVCVWRAEKRKLCEGRAVEEGGPALYERGGGSDEQAKDGGGRYGEPGIEETGSEDAARISTRRRNRRIREKQWESC